MTMSYLEGARRIKAVGAFRFWRLALSGGIAIVALFGLVSPLVGVVPSAGADFAAALVGTGLTALSVAFLSRRA